MPSCFKDFENIPIYVQNQLQLAYLKFNTTQEITCNVFSEFHIINHNYVNQCDDIHFVAITRLIIINQINQWTGRPTKWRFNHI